MGQSVTKRARALNPLLDRLLGRPPAHIAVWRPGGMGLTYGALTARSAQVASRLLDGRSTLQGGRVALLLPPGDEFVVTLLAIWRAGGVAVPLSAVHTPPELAHILATATPEATVVSPALAAPLTDLPIGRRLQMATPAAGIAAGIDPEGAAPAAVEGGLLPEPAPGDHAALMLFTSGTTGKPKGVLLSHAGVAATLASLAEAWHWREGDTLLHALPLYHTHGLIVALLGALWAGATVRFASFEAVAIWEAFADASVFMAVPTMYVRLVEAFAAAPPDRQGRWAVAAGALRLCTSGSAALPASVLGAFGAATGQTILERYGMTEIGMALSNPYQGPRVPGAVGLPLPGVHVDIVRDRDPGDTDNPEAAGDPGDGLAPDGEPGELRVRSPQLFLGYQGDPVGTAASFDAAGRFRTGDTAVRDAHGVIRLLGRTSVDILKSGGYKLSALEIEEVLRGHSGVAEVAVIGVPDPVWGDCVTACVVPRVGVAPPSLDDLRAFARDELAPYKLPRALRLLAALPRNPMGKVQKSLLK